jgi:glycerophosphoryl diester phosphodiesterase
LSAVAHYCLRNGFFLNIEIKPSPGTELLTGQVVADHAAQLWQGAAVPPLLTSFDVPALEGARQARPHLPRGLLLDTLTDGWLETALRLECVAVVCNHLLWDASSVAQAKAAGLRTLSYTVNETAAAQRLIDLVTDGIITDKVDLFAPAS